VTSTGKKHFSIKIQGIVQGVGFRPFIHRLAHQWRLTGTVRNDSSGVYIEVEGRENDLSNFLSSIPVNAPPLAVIDCIDWEETPLTGLEDFTITASEKLRGAISPVSPDIATCEDCFRELMDSDDRRYRYPFINCTNCGPRYTIINEMPYDRQSTTMAAFTMCPACENEFKDPDNRRFHAQPNACWTCGPKCQLLDNQGRYIPCNDPIKRAREQIRNGNILAVKSLGGFQLVSDACNETTTQLLRQRKRRDEKPFALMSKSLDDIRQFGDVSPDEEVLLLAPQRPIVLLRKKSKHGIAPSVAPRNHTFGVMLPTTPLHYLLFEEDDFCALIMTSGNFSEEPIVIENRQAVEFLQPIADFFLIHNRDILIRNDDSVCRSFDRKMYFIRRSRGYAPAPILMKWPLPPILAVGAELKNTVALSRGEKIFVSQHIGDLENSEVFNSFEDTIQHLQKLFKIKPEIVAYDLHPEYLSTKYALSREDSVTLEGIQHHHAHIASCMAENGVSETVIGLSLDGIGYGTDGTLWGGEFLIADLADFERACHFNTILMPGGTRAIREPWRMAVSYLFQAFGHDFRKIPLPFLDDIDARSLDLLIQMIERKLNCPETSSLGRLFDGVAALCNLRHRVYYEGQAAIELEMCLEETPNRERYSFIKDNGIIHLEPVVKAVVEDILSGVPPSVVSFRFHQGLLHTMVDICDEIRQTRGLDTVALSGGVFQNMWLLQNLHHDLKKKGFRVLTHHLVPCNDGGISLGQIVVAAQRQLGGFK